MGKIIITLLALLGMTTLLLGMGIFEKTWIFPGTHTSFTYGATALVAVLFMSSGLKST